MYRAIYQICYREITLLLRNVRRAILHDHASKGVPQNLLKKSRPNELHGVHSSLKGDKSEIRLQAGAVDDLDVNNELVAVVVEDKDANTAVTLVEGSL